MSAGTPREIQLGTAAPDPKDRVEILRWISEAEEDINRKAYRPAAKLMQQALERDPTNPLSMIYLASSFEKMGDYPRAIEIYKHALALKLGTDQIYSRLGRDYLRLHDIPKAADALTQANRMNPTDLDNLRNLGTAELQLGRVDEAERAFKAITLQNDRYSAAYNGLGLVAIRRVRLFSIFRRRSRRARTRLSPCSISVCSTRRQATESRHCTISRRFSRRRRGSSTARCSRKCVLPFENCAAAGKAPRSQVPLPSPTCIFGARERCHSGCSPA